MKKTVSPQFRSLILQNYPILKTNSHYLKLFHWLCFGTYLADIEKATVPPLALPHEYLAKINEADPSHFRSGPFLQSFKDNVLPAFEWCEWIPPSFLGSGKKRYVTNYGLSPEIQDAVRNEFLYDGPKVYFSTGHKTNNAYDTGFRKLDSAEYAQRKATWTLNATQTLILNALEESNGVGIAKRMAKFKPALMAAANQLPNSDSAAHQLKILSSIEDDARLFYSPAKRTCRLHAQWGSVCQLKKQLRHILCQGWVEIDLVSSQFAILAAILKAKLCTVFVKSKDDLWTYLNGGTKPDASLKKDLKEFIYATCFGGNQRFLAHLARKTGRPLMKDPLIQELLQAREPWLKQIEANNSIQDVWGTIHQDRKASSLAATLIQSIEMELVASSFEILPELKKSNQASIQLFQHDGFTLSVGDLRYKPEFESRLQTALATKAQKLGQQLGIDLSGVRYSFDYLPEINL